jgi:hypothetical protein
MGCPAGGWVEKGKDVSGEIGHTASNEVGCETEIMEWGIGGTRSDWKRGYEWVTGVRFLS